MKWARFKIDKDRRTKFAMSSHDLNYSQLLSFVAACYFFEPLQHRCVVAFPRTICKLNPLFHLLKRILEHRCEVHAHLIDSLFQVRYLGILFHLNVVFLLIHSLAVFLQLLYLLFVVTNLIVQVRRLK